MENNKAKTKDISNLFEGEVPWVGRDLSHGQLHECVTCVVTLGSAYRRAPCLVYCAAVALKILYQFLNKGIDIFIFHSFP